ncbi:hypothetical protein RRG08_063180 [Elysia crispata]|uniref:Sushi domain-containing protein n=1 Tax=Elysia crispata TaxID=231223 RepID=A0AAE1D5A6_9GAST|nr:hypothetical protein RRG08_063180 [Elysia crispata]
MFSLKAGYLNICIHNLHILLILSGLLMLSILPLVSAGCPTPEIPNDVYSFTQIKSSYATGAVFDIVCVPGYGTDTVVQLKCDSSGEWHGHWPDCSKSENKAKWWMLLLGMVGVVVLIPCILPRLYFTFIDSSSPRKDFLINKRRKSANKRSDRIRMQSFSSQPAKMPTTTQSHNPESIYPKPLPSIRRQRDHAISNDGQVAE